jgi:GxxExxY protein
VTAVYTDLRHGDLTEKIIGVFYDAYNELGYGFLESVYKASLFLALQEAGLTVERQVAIPVWFRGQKVGEFRADLRVNGFVLLELKCSRVLDVAHEAQLLHYLRATEVEVGLLLNFGEKPQFKRLVLDNARKRIRVNPCKSVAGVLE